MLEQWWRSKTHNNVEYEYFAKDHYESDQIFEDGDGRGYYSQLDQDIFVSQVLNYKTNGTFVDIGAAHPIKINNTYKLEDDFNWSGVSIDFGPPQCVGLPSGGEIEFTSLDYEEFWNKYRKTPIIVGDALEIDYKELFEKYNLPKTIDYLTVDIEPPLATFKALQEVFKTGYKFNVITFETERDRICICNADSRFAEYTTPASGYCGNEQSREFITSFGYERVSCSVPDTEDWYIHKDYIEENPDYNYFHKHK